MRQASKRVPESAEKTVRDYSRHTPASYVLEMPVGALIVIGVADVLASGRRPAGDQSH